MACLEQLPFQDGRPLSPIEKEEAAMSVLSTTDPMSVNNCADRHMYMATIDEVKGQYDNELPGDISTDELTVNAR